MATKYTINRPCTDILARIRAEWRATLAHHDAKEAENRARLARLYGVADRSQSEPQHDAEEGGRDQGEGGGGASHEEDIIVHPASVIGLLRQCGYNDPDLLFSLFYALSRTTWQFGGPALGHHLAPLSSADVERLIVGVERLRNAHYSFAAAVLDCTHAPTNPPHFCLQAAAEVWSGIRLVLQQAGGRAREPLEEWREVLPLVHGQYVNGQFQMCQFCERSLASRIELFRQSLWAALPGYLALS
ncbi:hypothetical protein BN946_scf184570.g2 [Trametes cinnabarina]|uniref:Uncharacterized protein n=1 Tax=Pycnoporus cinnabarinus TaxID=5643 RepID=A0A060SPI8_PYCCI|nr:hypothetical protein BN946_scf184570.g2 [Trametes cinnabarina]